MAIQFKEETASLVGAQTMSHHPWAMDIPRADALLSSQVSSEPTIYKVERRRGSRHQEDEKRPQVTKPDHGVLALRWSDSRGTVMLVDILTGTVKAEWNQKSEPKSIEVKAA